MWILFLFIVFYYCFRQPVMVNDQLSMCLIVLHRWTPQLTHGMYFVFLWKFKIKNNWSTIGEIDLFCNCFNWYYILLVLLNFFYYYCDFVFLSRINTFFHQSQQKVHWRVKFTEMSVLNEKLAVCLLIGICPGLCCLWILYTQSFKVC